MRFQLSFIATLATLAFSSTLACNGVQARVNWPDVVQCAGDGVSSALPAVSTILATDGGPEQTTLTPSAKEQLRQLALKFNVSTVACGIQRLVSDWTRPPAASAPDGTAPLAQDPQILAAAARGQAFLEEVGTTVELDRGGTSGSK
jgi:hypothetical protein